MSRPTSPTVVLVHGAWADGSSWSRVITGLGRAGIPAIAAPIPLTTLAQDVDALDRTIDRTNGPLVVVGHAYAGGVIGATGHPRVAALVYVAALAPDEGETVADVFYRAPSGRRHLRGRAQPQLSSNLFVCGGIPPSSVPY